MSLRIHLLAALAVAALAACDDGPAAVSTPEPNPVDPAPAMALVAAEACDGSTMPLGECEALVAFFNTAGGPETPLVYEWVAGENPCDWYGVVCTGFSDHGSVERLQPEYSEGSPGFAGTLAPELGDLTELTYLILGENGFTGPIPSEIGNLTQLSILHLHDNALTGPIPSSFVDLQSLEYLLLHDNQLNGPIPAWLSDLSSLTGLSLRNNQFSGPIPPELGNASTLESLGLGGNQLTGPIPAELGGLTNLTSFRAEENDLSGVLPLELAAWDGALTSCTLKPGNEGLFLPDLPEYRALDGDGDDMICGLPFASPGEIGEGAAAGIGELVPDVLNEGQANALQAKIDNAVAKAEAGHFQAAINQMWAFLTQLEDMVAGGTLTPEEAAPFIQQAEALIAIWTAEL